MPRPEIHYGSGHPPDLSEHQMGFRTRVLFYTSDVATVAGSSTNRAPHVSKPPDLATASRRLQDMRLR